MLRASRRNEIDARLPVGCICDRVMLSTQRNYVIVAKHQIWPAFGGNQMMEDFDWNTALFPVYDPCTDHVAVCH